MSFVHKRKEKERIIIVLLRQTVCRTWFWFLVVKRILVNIMLSVLLRNTDSYYSFGIFKLFLYHGGQFYDTSSTRKTIDLPPVTAKLYHMVFHQVQLPITGLHCCHRMVVVFTTTYGISAKLLGHW
jgi:hypothetical protein